MNTLPLLSIAILAGCAAPTEQLITEAKECVASHISSTGVMGKPTEEDTKECWVDVNARMNAEAKRKQKKIEAKCPSGSVLVVNSRLQQSGCMRRSEIRDIFGGRY